jgi:hypothetical protein
MTAPMSRSAIQVAATKSHSSRTPATRVTVLVMTRPVHKTSSSGPCTPIRIPSAAAAEHHAPPILYAGHIRRVGNARRQATVIVPDAAWYAVA